jgi:hypothetical protein
MMIVLNVSRLKHQRRPVQFLIVYREEKVEADVRFERREPN